MLAPSTEYYEKQKRIYERLAELERQRLDVEQTISKARIEAQSSLTEDESGIERLKKNVRESKTKIEENREIMRQVDRLLLRLDSVADECDYLQSLKNNMIDYAKEAYERWRSEDPGRAARYWAEQGKRDPSSNVHVFPRPQSAGKVQKSMAKEPSVTDDLVQQNMILKLNQSNGSDMFEISQTSQKSPKSSPKKGKSPRFNELVQVTEFYKDDDFDSGSHSDLNKDIRNDTPDDFESARTKSVEDDEFRTSRDRFERNPDNYQPSRGFEEPRKEPSPVEFFSPKNILSKKESLSDFYDGSKDTDAILERNEIDRSFAERRSSDEKNEFFLDEKEKSERKNEIESPKKEAALTFKGLQSLLHRIEDFVTDQLSPRDEIYSQVSHNFDEKDIILKANENNIERESVQNCCQVVLKSLPVFTQNHSIFKPGSDVKHVNTFNELDSVVDAENKQVYCLIRDHLKYLVIKNSSNLDSIAKSFAEAMEEKLTYVFQLALKACLESAKADDLSEATSISSFSTPRSFHSNSAMKSSTPRKPILKSSSSINSENFEAELAAGAEKHLNDKGSKNVSRNASKDDDEEDSFPFTSQSMDDHFDISIHSGTAEKTSDAYQSLLKSAFGGGDPNKQSASRKTISDEEDEVEGMLKIKPGTI